jgi:tetratricopeptide (TPR) repeat protein
MLEAAPEVAGAHVEYARFLARIEGADAATAHLRKALDEVSDPLAVLGALAEVQLASGETEAAAATVQEMEARDAGDPRTHLAKGSVALRQGRPAEAVEVLRDSVSVHARPDAYRVLATALMQTGAMEEALQAADRAIELYPAYNREAQRLRIDILRRQDDWEGVGRALLDMARRGMQLTPPEREVLVAALYRTGRRAPARKMLDRMLAREDASPGVVLLFARWERSSQPERARELLEASFAEHPGSMGLLDALVGMELQSARPEQALAHIDRAAAAGLDDPRLSLYRARALAGLGRADEAVEAAHDAFERMPRSRQVMDLLVSLYLATGREDEAIRSFEQAREAGMLEPGGEVVLGRLYLQAGRRADAIATLERAVARGSAPPVARNDLAYLLAEDGTDLDRALSLALEAKEALPNDAAVADTLGYVLLQRGLPGPAEARFREAVRLAEEQQQARPEYHYRLGLALQQLGRPAEAAEAFEAALALDAGFASAEDARAALEAARAAAPAS